MKNTNEAYNKACEKSKAEYDVAFAAASDIKTSKRAAEMGKRVVLSDATITRTKTGVVVESRGAGRPSNPQPTRNVFALADNAMYSSIDEMFVSFVDHFTNEDGQ